MHGLKHRTLQTIAVLSHTQKNATVFQLNLFVILKKATGHKEGTIDFSQGKTLTRSTANTAVSSSAHFIGGWVDLRSGLDTTGKIRTSYTYRDWKYPLVARSAV